MFGASAQRGRCDSSFPGGDTGGATPVPIPNTVVKPSKADGTPRATVWERRTSPGINSPTAQPRVGPFAFVGAGLVPALFVFAEGHRFNRAATAPIQKELTLSEGRGYPACRDG